MSCCLFGLLCLFVLLQLDGLYSDALTEEAREAMVSSFLSANEEFREMVNNCTAGPTEAIKVTDFGQAAFSSQMLCRVCSRM